MVLLKRSFEDFSSWLCQFACTDNVNFTCTQLRRDRRQIFRMYTYNKQHYTNPALRL